MVKKFINLIRTNSDIALILVVATFLRLKIILQADLWYDEAFTGLMMRIPFKQLAQIIHEDPHPPLYFFINKVWCVLFGVNDLSLRLLPFVFGFLTIIAVYIFAKDLFNKETAIIASLLCAISPFLVEYSVEARSYSLYAFLTIIAAYFVYKRQLNLFIISAIALLFTHYMSLAYLPILLLYYCYVVIKYKLSKKLAIARLALFGAASLFIYRFGILSSIKNQNVDWAEKANITNMAKSATSYLFGVKTKLPGHSVLNDMSLGLSKEHLIAIVFTLFIVALVIALYKNRSNRHNFANLIYVNLFIFVPQLILIIYGTLANKTLYVERYLVPSAVFLVISLAMILKSVLRFEIMALVLMIYVYMLTTIIPQSYYKGMRDLVNEFGHYSTDIVFTSPVDYTVGRYYFGSVTGNDYLDLSEENIFRIKLYDPQHVEDMYTTWWFISEQARPTNWVNSIVISPDEKRMTPDFKKVSDKSYGNYEVYIKTTY